MAGREFQASAQEAQSLVSMSTLKSGPVSNKFGVASKRNHLMAMNCNPRDSGLVLSATARL